MKFGRFSYYNKIISLITLTLFSFSSVAAASPQTVYQIKVQEEAGKVNQRYKGSSEKTIIHIQDAHASLKAQENIKKIIEELLKQNVTDLIGIEGAVGELPIYDFRNTPFKEARNQVAQNFMEKGLFGGGELAAITSPEEGKLFGVEEKELFQNNFKTFNKGIQNRETAQETLETLENNLKTLKQSFYNEKLFNFDQQFQNYLTGETPFLDFIPILFEHGMDLLVHNATFPYLERFREMVHMKSDFDMAEANQEKEMVLERLKEVGGIDGELELPEYETLQMLSIEAPKNGILFDTYLQLKQLIKYQKLLHSLDFRVLLLETHEAAYQIELSLAENPEAKQVILLSKKIALLNRICSLEAERTELDTFLATESEFDFDGLTFKVKGLMEKSGKTFKELHASDFNNIIQTAKAFYEEAAKRDHAMVHHLIQEMDVSGQETAILLAGGFHTDGIAKDLKERGISFLTVTPNLDTVGKDLPYLEFMTGNLFPIPQEMTSHIKAAVFHFENYVGELFQSFENEVLERALALLLTTDGPIDFDSVRTQLREFAEREPTIQYVERPDFEARIQRIEQNLQILITALKKNAAGESVDLTQIDTLLETLSADRQGLDALNEIRRLLSSFYTSGGSETFAATPTELGSGITLLKEDDVRVENREPRQFQWMQLGAFAFRFFLLGGMLFLAACGVGSDSPNPSGQRVDSAPTSTVVSGSPASDAPRPTWLQLMEEAAEEFDGPDPRLNDLVKNFDYAGFQEYLVSRGFSQGFIQSQLKPNIFAIFSPSDESRLGQNIRWSTLDADSLFLNDRLVIENSDKREITLMHEIVHSVIGMNPLFWHSSARMLEEGLADLISLQAYEAKHGEAEAFTPYARNGFTSIALLFEAVVGGPSVVSQLIQSRDPSALGDTFDAAVGEEGAFQRFFIGIDLSTLSSSDTARLGLEKLTLLVRFLEEKGFDPKAILEEGTDQFELMVFDLSRFQGTPQFTNGPEDYEDAIRYGRALETQRTLPGRVTRDALELYRQGLTALESEDFDNAITLFNEALEIEENYSRAQLGIALTYFMGAERAFERGDTAAARISLRRSDEALNAADSMQVGRETEDQYSNLRGLINRLEERINGPGGGLIGKFEIVGETVHENSLLSFRVKDLRSETEISVTLKTERFTLSPSVLAYFEALDLTDKGLDGDDKHHAARILSIIQSEDLQVYTMESSPYKIQGLGNQNNEIYLDSAYRNVLAGNPLNPGDALFEEAVIALFHEAGEIHFSSSWNSQPEGWKTPHQYLRGRGSLYRDGRVATEMHRRERGLQDKIFGDLNDKLTYRIQDVGLHADHFFYHATGKESLHSRKIVLERLSRLFVKLNEPDAPSLVVYLSEGLQTSLKANPKIQEMLQFFKHERIQYVTEIDPDSEADYIVLGVQGEDLKPETLGARNTAATFVFDFSKPEIFENQIAYLFNIMLELFEIALTNEEISGEDLGVLAQLEADGQRRLFGLRQDLEVARDLREAIRSQTTYKGTIAVAA